MSLHTVRKVAKHAKLVFFIGRYLFLIVFFYTIAVVGQTSDTARNFWPAVEARTQLRSDLHLLLF